MGVNNSKFIHKSNNHNKKLQIIDFGSIIPLGLYNNKNDEYDLNLVRELILSKKLSPFYKGLSNPLEYTDNEKILLENSEGDIIMNKDRKTKRSTISNSNKKKRKQLDINNDHDDYILYLFNNETKLYNTLYSNSVECPICFLYYPANINFARCCDQPICTECFVQIKKGTADYNNASSSSSSSHIQCPYCMTEDFGIIYQSPQQQQQQVIKENKSYQVMSTTSGLSENQHSKRKSIESSHPDVVLIDHVRSQYNNDDMTSSSNLLIRATSLQFWFQSRPNDATSLERYLATIRLDDMSLEDIMVIQSIRQSLIDKENSRQSMY